MADGQPCIPAWPSGGTTGGGAGNQQPKGPPEFIVPVAPGATIGRPNIDVDAGWDPSTGTWKKNPGQKSLGPISINDGHGSWNTEPGNSRRPIHPRHDIFNPSTGLGGGSNPWDGSNPWIGRAGNPGVIVGKLW